MIEEGKSGEAKRETHFVINGIGAHGEPWLVKFREAFSVNLRVLELAVFDPEGHVRWRLGQKAPDHLLPGWKERFRRLESRLGNGHNPDALGSLTHFDDDHELRGEFIDSSYIFPLKRTVCIRSPYAEAIQASFAAFLSRAALSHDFANSLWPSKSESAD